MALIILVPIFLAMASLFALWWFLRKKRWKMFLMMKFAHGGNPLPAKYAKVSTSELQGFSDESGNSANESDNIAIESHNSPRSDDFVREIQMITNEYDNDAKGPNIGYTKSIFHLSHRDSDENLTRCLSPSAWIGEGFGAECVQSLILLPSQVSTEFQEADHATSTHEYTSDSDQTEFSDRLSAISDGSTGVCLTPSAWIGEATGTEGIRSLPLTPFQVKPEFQPEDQLNSSSTLVSDSEQLELDFRTPVLSMSDLTSKHSPDSAIFTGSTTTEVKESSIESECAINLSPDNTCQTIDSKLLQRRRFISCRSRTATPETPKSSIISKFTGLISDIPRQFHRSDESAKEAVRSSSSVKKVKSSSDPTDECFSEDGCSRGCGWSREFTRCLHREFLPRSGAVVPQSIMGVRNQADMDPV